MRCCMLAQGATTRRVLHNAGEWLLLASQPPGVGHELVGDPLRRLGPQELLKLLLGQEGKNE